MSLEESNPMKSLPGALPPRTLEWVLGSFPESGAHPHLVSCWRKQHSLDVAVWLVVGSFINSFMPDTWGKINDLFFNLEKGSDLIFT